MAWLSSPGQDLDSGIIGSSFSMYNGVSGVTGPGGFNSSSVYFNVGAYGRIKRIAILLQCRTDSGTADGDLYWRGGYDFEQDLFDERVTFAVDITASTTEAVNTVYIDRNGVEYISGPGGGTVSASPYIFDVPWLAFDIENTDATNDFYWQIVPLLEID